MEYSGFNKKVFIKFIFKLTFIGLVSVLIAPLGSNFYDSHACSLYFFMNSVQVTLS